MLARLSAGALLLTAALALAGPPPRVYVVRWADAADASPERRALIEQADRQLRDELRRRGAAVVEAPVSSPAAILLRPSLEVFPLGLRLNLVGVRGRDQAVLGTVSTKASGSTRAAQLRAVVQRACSEAEALE